MLGLVPEEPGVADVIAEQRELLARLGGVVEAEDAEISVLRAELDAERGCGGGWSCGSRRWNGSCGWTARAPGRRRRRSAPGRRSGGGRNGADRNRSGSGGRTAAGAGSRGIPGRAWPGTWTRASA